MSFFVQKYHSKYKHDHMGDDLNHLHWLDIKKRIVFKLALLSHEAIISTAPEYLEQMFQYSYHGHSLKLLFLNNTFE